MTDHRQITKDYSQDGVVRIRGFLPPEQVSEIRAELTRYIRDDLDTKPADARTLEEDGKTVRNLWRLQEHDAYFRSLAQRPEITELVAELVKGDPFLMAVETFNKPAKIGSGVPYHQDNAYFCQEPPDVLTVWVAIDPVTMENGPVYFIKGSHRAGTLPSAPSGVRGNSIGLAEPPSVPRSEQFCATLEPGDATIHHCNTIHHSDPNRSDQSRLGLLIVYRGAQTATLERLESAYREVVAAMPPA